MSITNEYDNMVTCTDNENEDTNTIVKYILSSIPSCIFLLCPISLIIWTILKH